jgi:hypothetical protein
MKTTKSLLLGTAAYYASPTDQAAAAPEETPSTEQCPAYTSENESSPSADARKGRPQRARAPPSDQPKPYERRRAALSKDPQAGASAMSIARFCVRNEISEPMFHKLRANGLGPDVMDLGGRSLITIEAERRWRLERERNPVRVDPLDRERRERVRQKREQSAQSADPDA